MLLSFQVLLWSLLNLVAHSIRLSLIRNSHVTGFQGHVACHFIVLSNYITCTLTCFCYHSHSALMSFVSSKSAHDISPHITAEITELLALVGQMEKHSLDTQAMQNALENRMNQAQRSLEQRTESFKRDKAAISSNTEVDSELSSAFERLHTQGRQKDVGNLGVTYETIEDKLETRSDLMDTALPVVSSYSSGSLEASDTVPSEVESLWTRIVSLAEKVGIDGQKILSVKTI